MGKHSQETKAARRHVIIGLWMLRSGVFGEIRKNLEPEMEVILAVPGIFRGRSFCMLQARVPFDS